MLIATHCMLCLQLPTGQYEFKLNTEKESEVLSVRLKLTRISMNWIMTAVIFHTLIVDSSKSFVNLLYALKYGSTSAYE